MYGKISRIVKNGYASDPVRVLNYTYDAAGNRISKEAYRQGREGLVPTTTWYVRDAQGNVMAVYSGSEGSWLLEEQHLYGSSRIGIHKPYLDMEAGFPAKVPIGLLGYGDTLGFKRGNKFYELSNHLGNVLVTVGDKKFGHNSGGGVDYYTADVVTAQDYYPFGMLMPGRQYVNNGIYYRYGFNGKENDGDIKGDGNSYDYGARIYDPKVGRWLSVDPLQSKYQFLSPYSYVANSPLIFIDPDGKKIILSGSEQNQKSFVASLRRLTGFVGFPENSTF